MIYHPHAIYYRNFLAVPDEDHKTAEHLIHEDLPDCACGHCNFSHCAALRPPCPTWKTVATILEADKKLAQQTNAYGLQEAVSLRRSNCFDLQILTAASGRVLLHVSCPKRCFPGVLARWIARQTFSKNPNNDRWQCSYIGSTQGARRKLCPLDYTCIILDFLPEIWYERINGLTLELVWHLKHTCSGCEGQLETYPIASPMPTPCCHICGDRPADHHPGCCSMWDIPFPLGTTQKYWRHADISRGAMERLLQHVLLPYERINTPTTWKNLGILCSAGPVSYTHLTLPTTPYV